MSQELDSPDVNLGGVDPKSAPRGIDLTKLASPELLALFDGVLVELRARGLVRSSNNPVADYAESLVARALGLKLETKSTTGYDAKGPDGLKYEIKGRRPTPANKSRQLSVILGLDNRHFDYLAGVLFEPDFRVSRACLIPFDAVKAEATFRPHVNGWVLLLRDSIWDRSDVRDVTAEVVAAQRSH